MTKNDILTIGLTAAAIFGTYKLVSLMIEADKKEAEKKAEFEKFVKEELASGDYKTKINLVSLHNEDLDPKQRMMANDILNELFSAIKKSTTYDEFDERMEKFMEIYDIFASKDNNAILAILERRVQIIENRKLIQQREHELAVAKAAGENEIEIAKISANAEKAKAQLYSNGIRNAATIISEVTNERKQES